MGRRTSSRLIWGIVLGALPLVAVAQAPFNLESQSTTEAKPELGGIPTVDIITLRAVGPGSPLRYGNVVAASEIVHLNGRKLTRGQDYVVDYAAGVVYLRVSQREGETMSVSYRYTKEPNPKNASPFMGIGGFKYSVAPESLNLILGFGMAERGNDGSVLQSNVFGFNNSFKFAGSTMNGVYLYGDRTKASNQGGLNFDRNEARGGESPTEGKSQLILQNLSSNLLGGQASFDYQDVDKTFANFSSAKTAGLDDATLTRLQNEKGMTRFGMALKDIKVGSASFSNSYRTVGENKSGITWRSMGVKQGGLSMNWSSQKVDGSFNRFNNIAESDRAQLQREVGMSRDVRTAELVQKFGKLGFNTSSIVDDTNGKGIKREELTLDTRAIKFNLGFQDTQAGFGRVGSLLGDEQARYGREVGVTRRWTGLQTSLFGSRVAPINFKQSLLSDKSGEFRARDLSTSGKGWSLQVADRKTDANFTRMGAMADQEADAHVRTIAEMYGPNLPVTPDERARFLSGVGISRDFSRFAFQPFKNWKADFSNLGLKGRTDKGSLQTASLNTGNAEFKYRKQQLGAQFNELTSMMNFERAQLGTIVGLDRTDLGMNARLGGDRKLSMSKMTASVGEANANRTQLGYTDRKIDAQYSAREVSSGFSMASQLVDAEKDLLATMTGFRQKEGKLRWELFPGVNVNAMLSDAQNETGDEFRRMRSLSLNWNVDKTTQFQYVNNQQKSTDPISTLFANNVEQMMLSKNFGRFGQLKVSQEVQQFDGTNGTQPDMRRQFLSYETKVDARTSLRTEQTRTRYDNGEKEDVSANTVSTSLNKRLGVAVTDVNVDRKGDDRDERRRNYGFWYDLGRGLMLSYGYARHLNGEDGTGNTSVSLGTNQQALNPDQVQNVQAAPAGDLVVGAAYGANEWDRENRVQSFSRININNAKAYQLGDVRDVKFNFSLDTAADRSAWLRENRLMGFSGSLYGQTFSFDYRGQMDAQGMRGVDRTYKWNNAAKANDFLHASIMYKLRTLPGDKQVMIRDYNITARVLPNVDLTNQVQTNPEIVRGDVFLGSLPQAARSNKWRFDLKNSANLTLGAQWEELVNEQANHLSRTGGITMKLFEKSGSPLSLFYGVEQARRPDFDRITQRYSLQFDQKGGPNQVFSLFLGNVSYEHSIQENFKRNNWSMRLDYQLRF